MHHPNNGALIADLQSKRPETPFSEEAKQLVHTMRNVECFELYEISPQIQCPYCMQYLTDGTVYCDCGTCLVPAEVSRTLNRERFDTLTILDFLIKQGGSHGARNG